VPAAPVLECHHQIISAANSENELFQLIFGQNDESDLLGEVY
jgi:hypothetical protein